MRACSVVSDSFDPVGWSPPGFSVHGIFQARIPERVTISYSRGSSRPREQTHVPCIPALAGNSVPLVIPGKSSVKSDELPITWETSLVRQDVSCFLAKTFFLLPTF